MKIVLAGGSGFLGRALMAAWPEPEWVILARPSSTREIPGGRTVGWDGRIVGAWATELDGADAVVNLAGAPVTLKWTPENRALILSSRVDSTAAIAKAIRRCVRPPAVWLNGSATGFYGDTGEQTVDESCPAGFGFLGETCVAWEAAATAGPTTRVVHLRTGVVLGNEGGAFPLFRQLTAAFIGGAVGTGRQFMSWIHVDDHIRMMRWALENESVSCPINAVAPVPVRQGEFMTALRRAMGRPWAPSAPAFAMRLVGALGGPDPSIVLDSVRVTPAVALAHGFRWEYGDLTAALRSLVVASGR